MLNSVRLETMTLTHILHHKPQAYNLIQAMIALKSFWLRDNQISMGRRSLVEIDFVRICTYDLP